MTRKLVMLLFALAVVAGGWVEGEASDPAVAQVRTLNAALLKSMHAGRSESMAERYRSLEPVIQQVFALPLMTRIAVGPSWSTFTPEQQQAAIAAFTRFTTANYAFNFRDYDGQKLEIDSQVATRDEDRIVRARIISTHGTQTELLYRMRQVDGVWKVLDVYSDGVSELILRRSDFSAALASGGAPALIAYLNKASEGLMK